MQPQLDNPELSSLCLHELIRRIFRLPDDEGFEDGQCTDWAVGFTQWLTEAYNLPSSLLIAYDDSGNLSHATVWIPSLQESFDWRGQAAQSRWTCFQSPSRLSWEHKPLLNTLGWPSVSVGLWGDEHSHSVSHVVQRLRRATLGGNTVELLSG